MEWGIVWALLFMYSIYLAMGILTIVLLYTEESSYEFRVVFLIFFTSFFNLFCGCFAYYRIKKRQEERLRLEALQAQPQPQVVINIPMNTIEGTMIEQPDGKIDIGT
jgi:hypothetical protein